MSRWEKWRSCFFLNYLFNCEKKYFESLLHNRDLRDAFEEVSAEFRLAQAQQRLMANSSEEGDGMVSIIYLTNSTIFVFDFLGLSFDCLLRWIRALARTPCSAPCPDWCAAGTSAARLLPAEAPPIGEDWVWFWQQLPLNPCSRFDNLRDQIQEKEDDSTKYKYDNTTSQECNDLIESMESSRAIRFVLISVQSSWRVI